MPNVRPEWVDAVERLGASCTGDVGALVAGARAQVAATDDATLASTFESAAQRRAAAGDRTAAWWLACAAATLRASPVASAQEDAEIIAARSMGELGHSPAARAPLPEAARWIVAGVAEPPPNAQSIELARRNARAHLERLAGELASRAPSLRMQAEAARLDGNARFALENALRSYEVAIAATRASLARAVDHVVARGGDPSIAQAGAAALAELDDAVAPNVHERLRDARRAVEAPGVPGTKIELAVTEVAQDRPSFAGAAPPSFRQGASAHGEVAAPIAAPVSVSAATSASASTPASPTRDDLDRAMHAAFERAWTTPNAETRGAFIQAVRARYALETASIADTDERERALDHYVAHAVAQLPPS